MGAGSSRCGRPAGALRHVPLRPWMRSVISKSPRPARIQLGRWPPGRVRLRHGGCPAQEGTQATGEAVALTRTMLGRTGWDLQQPPPMGTR